jgi:hypothetical protein
VSIHLDSRQDFARKAPRDEAASVMTHLGPTGISAGRKSDVLDGSLQRAPTFD